MSTALLESLSKIDNIKSNIICWLEHILYTDITMPDGVVFKLSELSHSDRINEFEFDFNMNEFDTSSVPSRVSDFDILVNSDLKTIKGVMNGKMDLFFRVKKKFYVLDWKSNFLGFTLEDYTPKNVAEAMADSNYHLQYLIYTMASRLYLKNRINDFDYDKHFGGVVYLFLRGVRNNAGNGIFVSKPKASLIDSLQGLVYKI